MAINLLEIQPHKVSRDLSGYITYVYGEPKTGKTTLATQMDGALLLACERGYNALPGVMPQDITSWGDMKAVVRQLKQPQVKERFKSVIVDTVDLAGAMCEQYINSQNGVDRLGDIPYGQGWTLLKREFEDTFRTVVQQGYALFFISHAKDRTVKTADGKEVLQIFPSCPNTFNEIAKNMADIYGYAQKYLNSEGEAKVRLILRAPDGTIDTGCRFKMIEPVINFSYQDLVNALNDAIDKEAKATQGQFVTTEREVAPVKEELNFDELIASFNQMVEVLMKEDEAYYAPRVISIVGKYLGKGKKISEATIEQVELINLVVTEIKEDLVSKL